MKSIQFSAYGDPKSVALHEIETPQPSAGEVLVALEAAPLNPSDFMLLDGHYPFHPELPSPAGSEGVGRVLQVGADVAEISVGDRALVLPSPQPRTWQELFLAEASTLVKVPSDGDVLQLATLGINAATAYLVLKYGGELPHGSWVAITAGNSDVASYVYALAKRAGLRTLGLVRRADAADAVRAAGADAVVVTDHGFLDRVAEILGADRLALLLDGVGGSPANELAAFLQREGHIVSYSALSGQPIAVHPMHLNFQNLHVDGFWLNNWLDSAPHTEIQEAYSALADLAIAGDLPSAIDSTFALEDFDAAIARATSDGRSGKVIFTAGGAA